MEIAGYIAAALIGISLGLVGGGGSIFTMPILVYLFRVSPPLATSYSLFVVGSTSLVGAVSNYKKGLINIKAALHFGFSSIATVFLTRKFLVPALPKQVAIGSVTISESVIIMCLFAVLMVFASVSMITFKIRNHGDVRAERNHDVFRLFFYGIAIGIITGLLGAGGGFLLIPTLVLLGHMPMKQAIGTSLLIIAMNSLIGFAGDIGHFNIDWLLLLKITSIAVAGIFVGGYIGKEIPGHKLKKAFGWFVLVVGIYIIIKEFF
jgi:uncharacterized membrane protein YfcA